MLQRLEILATLAALLGACASTTAPESPSPTPPEVTTSQTAEAQPDQPATAPPAQEENADSTDLLVPDEPLENLEQAEVEEPVPPPWVTEPVEAVDPQETIAQALEAYESAREFWQQGGFDDAFAALDTAYELMSGVEVNGDPLLAQQKENLRHLISRRIVEIYASRRMVVVGNNDHTIPLILNDHVEREIKSFQTAERQLFLAAYERSGLDRPMILDELRQRGMPEELSWLPMVESWFKVRAFSRARALGMWQFIPSTGYRFGLRRTSWFDERMDPAKSTRAALAYLGELHELFGDWTTALTAYNCGETRVLRIIKQQHLAYFDQFWDLYVLLPTETRRFVPRFLATLAIIQNPDQYGFEDLPEPLPPMAFETVETGRSARLDDLDRLAGLDKGSLAALNPELRHMATPDEPYTLKVPPGSRGEIVAGLERAPRYSPPVIETSIHRVRRGESLSVIARRYRTSVSTLMRLNNISNPHRIWPGQRLRVTGRTARTPVRPGERLPYTVRRGDSLWRIAQRFGTTVDRIKRDNSLRGNTLQPGQQLVIDGGTASGRTYVVRRGDTLSKIAGASRVPVRRLAEANGLTLRSTIYPGQRIHIPE